MARQRITITLRKNILKKIDSAVDGQKIRNRSHAIELFLSEKFKNSPIKKVVILGGKGMDFKGKRVSKLLLPVGKESLIERNIEILKEYGITDLILTVGEFGEAVRKKLADGSKYNIKISYFERDQGTASILRRAKDLLDSSFLMMNGDIFLENIDLDDMYEFHRKNNGMGTILIATSKDPSALGSIMMKGNQIVGFQEKKPIAENTSHLVNAGVYLLEPAVCEIITPNSSSLEYDIFPTLIQKGRLFGYHLSSPWIHLHDEERYNNYLNFLKK